MKNLRNKVVYIGNFSFPDMNAAGKRVYYNGKAIKSLGYEVIFAGTSKINHSEPYEILKTKEKFEDYYYYNFQYPKNSKDWIKYKSSFDSFVNMMDDIGPSTVKSVIMYNSPSLSLFNKKLIKYCRKNAINIISDCTDWLTTSTSNKIFNIVKNFDVWYQRTVLNKNCDAVICISSYLEDYYKKNVRTIVVPPLTDSFTDIPKTESTFIKIIYAGVPFRIGSKNIIRETMKDRLDLAIKFVDNLILKGVNVEFDIYGITKEEYLMAIPEDLEILDNLGLNIKFMGSVEQKIVESLISQYDYSILLREQSRDTLAGFSTKIAESISNGVPVITTDVGDVKQYIIEGINGIFVKLDSNNIDSYIKYFSEKKEVEKIRKSTSLTNPFEWSSYVDEFKKILK